MKEPVHAASDDAALVAELDVQGGPESDTGHGVAAAGRFCRKRVRCERAALADRRGQVTAPAGG